MRCWTSELTAHLGGELVGPDVSIEGAGIDSRTIRRGQLYAPIVAERDGHAFIPAALRRALGATKRQIRTPFLPESILLAVIGGVVGALTSESALPAEQRRRLHGSLLSTSRDNL